MRRSRVVDEYGCELTEEEQKELDEIAQAAAGAERNPTTIGK